jgi:predicted transposase YdaD
MALPFDATLKDLVQNHPHDWLAALGAPTAGPVSVLTPDLSTLTAFADIVLQAGDDLLHLDLQSGPDPNLPRRVLLYNVLLHERYGLPVHSVVVLLRPRADRSDLTGEVSYQARPGRGGLNFRCEVVRVWQQPVETLLAGGPGIIPLAPLGRLPDGVSAEEALPGVIERLAQRVVQVATPEEVGTLLTAAFVLTGMRLSRELVIRLFRGIRAMHESTTYQYILEEGAINEARKLLLRQGRKRFGDPTPAAEATLQAIADLDRLERMSDRLLEIDTWDALLETS